MIRLSKLFIIFLLLPLALLVFNVGCSLEPSNTEAESASTVPAGEALTSVDPTVTPEVDILPSETPPPPPSPTAEESDDHNVLVTITPDGRNSDSNNVLGTYINTNVDEYYMAVSYTLNEDAADLSQDMKRIIVTASLGNESSKAITVAENALTLIDEAGNRYAPNIYATAGMSPGLIGTELNPNEDVYGFVAFDIPSDANTVYLEWCLSGAPSCERPLHAPIP